MSPTEPLPDPDVDDSPILPNPYDAANDTDVQDDGTEVPE